MRFYLWLAALVMIFFVAPLYWLASNHPEYWWQQAEVGPQQEPLPLPSVIFVTASAYEDRPDELAAELSRLVKLGYQLAPSSGIGGRWFVMWLPQGCVMEIAKK